MKLRRTQEVPQGERTLLTPGEATFQAIGMSKLETIQKEIRSLSAKEASELEDWLANYLEEKGDLNPEFVASIERGKVDLREGRVRVRKPEQT